MATKTQHPFAELSNEELKEKEETLKSEIRRLGSAIEDERSELERLKERLRKGDRSVEPQVKEVKETIRSLKGQKSKKRSRMQTARRMRSSGSSSTAGKPSYGV